MTVRAWFVNLLAALLRVETRSVDEATQAAAAQAAVNYESYARLAQQNTDLRETDAARLNVQQRSIRRLFQLPGVIGRALQANFVSPGLPVDDETVAYEIHGPDGPWLTLFVMAYQSRIVARDASGHQADLPFDLANDGTGDLRRTMLLSIIGYGEIAKRNITDVPDVTMMNAELALPEDAAAATTES